MAILGLGFDWSEGGANQGFCGEVCALSAVMMVVRPALRTVSCGRHGMTPGLWPRLGSAYLFKVFCQGTL